MSEAARRMRRVGPALADFFFTCAKSARCFLSWQLKLSNAHLGLEQARLTARNLHFGTIAKLRVQTPIHAQFHAFDEIQIDDLPSIGAEEAIRIETLLECRQGAPKQRLRLSPRQPNVIALRAQQAPFQKRYEPAAVAVADKDLFQHGIGLRRSRSVSAFDSTQRLCKARRLDGFEQVVQRVDLEGSHCMFIVGRGEYNLRHVLEARERIATQAPRPLYV